MIDYAPDELLDFRRQGLPLGQLRKLLTEALALQRLAPVGMRRAPLRVVPRRLTAVADRLVRLPPGPQLHQRMHPGADVERPHVGPDVPHLLLTQALHLLEVVEVLLDAEAVRRAAEDLLRTQRHVGAEQRQPAAVL